MPNENRLRNDVTPSQRTVKSVEQDTSSNEIHLVEAEIHDLDEHQLNNNDNDNISSSVLSDDIKNLNLQDHNKNYAFNDVLSIDNQSQADFTKKFQSFNLNVNVCPILRTEFLPPRPDNGGKMGQPISLITNCLNMKVNPMKMYMYDIELTKADLMTTDKIQDFTRKMRFRENIRSVILKFLENKCKTPIFDGDRTIFTNQLLPFSEPVNEFNFEYNYENQKVICYLTLQRVSNEIDLNEINSYVNSRNGRSDNIPQECIRILDLITKQMFIQQNLVAIGNNEILDPKTSKNIPKSSYDRICGYFTTIRPHMSKIRFNLDTIQIVCHQPINMIDYIKKAFSLENFNMSNITNINRQLCNLKVKANHYKNNEGTEYSQDFIISYICNKNAEEYIIGDLGESVKDYFLFRHGIKLQYPNLLLIKMVTSKVLPAELLTVVPYQKVFENNLNVTGEVSEFSATSYLQRLKNLEAAIQSFNSFNEIEYLKSHDISINPEMINIHGRIMDEPIILFDKSEEKLSKSKFNLMQKRFQKAYRRPIIWTLFAFGDQRDYGNEDVLYNLEDVFPYAAKKVNIKIKRYEQFHYVTLDNLKSSINNIINKLKDSEELDLLLIVIRNDEEYKIVKEIGDIELGIVTQCLNYNNVSRQRNLPQYMANLMLKINAKLRGANWGIRIELSSLLGTFMVFGIDVLHPSSIGNKNQNSVAAMVGSINSTATVYSAVIRKQIFKDGTDIVEIVVEMQDMVYQLLMAFSDLNNSKLPEHLIFYRDRISEDQFEIVFNHEIAAIKYACEQLERNYNPKITYIIFQKQHNIHFFSKNSNNGDENIEKVPAGVVVDLDITDSRTFDFYFCSREGLQGTSKPAYYHVLFDENKWKSDDLQNFTHFLCYACFRCIKSISYPAPTYYARLAAFRSRILKDNEDSISISMYNENSGISASEFSVNELFQNKMFFI